MLKEIDKRGKLLVKIRCDTCGWVKWMKPKQVPRYHNCPQCIQNLNKVLMTPEQIKEVKKELDTPFEIKETVNGMEVTSETFVAPVDPQAETEKIIKKKKKSV